MARWRALGRWPDLALGVLLAAGAVVALAQAGQLGSFPASVCVPGFCFLVAGCRWKPLLVSVLAGVLIGIPEFAHDATSVYNNATFLPVWASIFVFSFALGLESEFPPSLVGLVILLAGANLTSGGFNPVPEMLAIGPYAGGLAVASRRQASAQLELRASELEEEREIFATQSVRYERARIARELHDIVAHCVSLMVVQANAGERLSSIDPDGAAEAFDSISEAARQAEDEINRLVVLLHDESPVAPSASVTIVEELVARAQESGLAVSLQLSGDVDDLTAGGADTAYRMIQEGITNALKHAPGSVMRISLGGDDDGVEITVVNGPARVGPSGLEHAGGGNGLAGMRERMVQCGGTLTAGATTDGGWELVGHLPRRMHAHVANGNGS
jgi:signal transduction histidine kinase